MNSGINLKHRIGLGLITLSAAVVLMSGCNQVEPSVSRSDTNSPSVSSADSSKSPLTFELILDADWVQTIPVGDYRELLVVDSDDPLYGLETMVAAQRGDVILFDEDTFRDTIRIYTTRIVDTDGNIWNDNVNNLGASITIGATVPFEGPASMRVHRAEEEPMRKVED